ncbi:MAG: phage portal protein [Treponema sp.]|jgi:HK97 family phage portal protein|nr:phage portal protein [Treponema sp.]
MFEKIKRFFRAPPRTKIKYTVWQEPYAVKIGEDATSFAAIDLICSAFAGLGGGFYSKITRGVAKHYIKNVLDEPNYDDTKWQFFYNSAKDYFAGNVYWYKFDIDGRVVSLFRLNPQEVRVDRDALTNEKCFYYNGNVYTREKIIHIPSRFNYDGLKGYSIFDTNRVVFENAAKLDKYVQNSFDQSIGKRLVIDVSGAMPDIDNEQIAEMKEKFIRGYAGVENSGVPVIQKKGISYTSVDAGSNDNRAMQLSETRDFQERETAKIFGVPLAMLNPTKGGDMETLYTLFLDNAVKPLAMSFEQAVNQYLLTPFEREEIYFEYNYNSLLRVNAQTRIDTYIKQINGGIKTVNEIRKMENSPIDEAGDVLFVPANLMPLTKENVEAYMAKSKQVLNNIEHPSESAHNQIVGDDKL